MICLEEILAVDFRCRISDTFVSRFILPGFVVLLLTRWRVACTKLLPGPIGNGDPDDDSVSATGGLR